MRLGAATMLVGRPIDGSDLVIRAPQSGLPAQAPKPGMLYAMYLQFSGSVSQFTSGRPVGAVLAVGPPRPHPSLQIEDKSQ